MPDRLRLLILGATGRLGRTLVQMYSPRYEVLSPGRNQLDLSKADEIEAILEGWAFDVVIHAAAITSPDACEEDPTLAWQVNAASAGTLAAVCAKRGARCIYVSTDYVFAGNGSAFLDEKAPAVPVNVYGQSKREGEMATLQACPEALVARVSWLFGPGGGGVPETALQRARQGAPLGFIEDKWSAPAYTVDIAQWLERLFTDLISVRGILHLCNTGVATWRDYAQVTLDVAAKHGLLDKPCLTEGLRLRDFASFKATRPPFTAMSNARLTFLLGQPPQRWQDALEAHLLSLIRYNNA